MNDEELAALGSRDYQGYVQAFAETPGVEIIDLGGVRIRRSDLPGEYLSSVFGTEVAPQDLGSRIAEVTDLLARAGRGFFWTVWPTDRPLDLADRLLAAGFQEEGDAPIMALDLRDPGPAVDVPGDLVVREATDPREQEVVAAFAVGSVVWEADGLEEDPFRSTFLRLARETPPRWRLFGGRLDGEVVACSALYTGGGVAGIYAVATAEHARGRGYGRRITQAAVDAGRAAGFEVSLLMASDLGEPVYRRLGFRAVGRTRFLHWPAMTGQ